MKKISLIILVISLFTFTSTYGQIKDFRNYQEIINNAEMNIIAGNNLQALNIYYNLLTKSDGNFSKDLYNSLILAKELNKLDTLFNLLELVKQKNFNNEYLIGLTEFSDLHSNPKWQEFINSNNSIIYIDTALRSKSDQLYVRDQFFRQKEGSYKVYRDTINKIHSINMSYLLTLISKNGLPGEKEIGAQDFSGWQGYDIVLHHNTQGRAKNKELTNLIPILIDQAIAGRIEPNKCSHYLEMQNEEFKAGVFDIYRVSFGEKYSKILAPVYTEENKLLINANRKLMCLEPIEDYYKKVKYITSHKDNKFKFDVILNTFEMTNETDFINFQKGRIEL